MIGRRLAHYDVIEKLGQGGMGEVYRAHDSKLGRDVALKVLPEDVARDPERRARFLREARAVAALKHPNIVTIHSVEEADGIPFLTMELVEGHSLSAMIPPDGLRLDHFFNYAVPLADAVAWAHERGITHRDLKPGNIMIDHDHRVKVLDFGLAKIFAAESNLENAETVMRTSDTAAGRILGTPAYMSPEQAEGKPVDHRSDIFSLGIVLYEMATGKRPFEGDTPISTISSILKDNPRSVSDLKAANPRELGRIISHCLEKDPERRFQSAKDIRNQMEGVRREVDSGEIVPPLKPAPASGRSGARAATGSRGRVLRIAVPAALVVIAGAWFGLRHWGGPNDGPGVPPLPPSAPPGRQMAVVFPFQNLGPADDEYFAAGVSEEITSRLASVSGLGVISRTSAENYDRTGKTTKQIGADLGVSYVLDGSVRWAKSEGGKGRVRITPQLVRVSDDTPIWTETYDREVSDIFDVQTDIATHVVEALGVTLHSNEREQLAEQPTSNVEAYQTFLKAKNLVCRDLACDGELVSLYERAATLDPQFLGAWYGLVRQHCIMYHVNADRTESRLAKAKTALDRMQAIDTNHPLTQIARGFYFYHGFRDYDRALAEFEAAAAQRPNDAEAIYSIGLIHRRRGDLAESAEAMERAIALDPKNSEYLWECGDTYDALRQPERALECLQRSFEVKHDPGVLNDRAMIMMRHHGDLRGARKLLAAAPDPTAGSLLPARVWVELLDRDYDQALAILRGTQIPAPTVGAAVASWMAVTETKRSGAGKARPALEDAERKLKAVLVEAPGDYTSRGYLSAVLAFLEHNEEAVREAKMAVELVAKDAYAGPGAQVNLAFVYANTGHPEEAIDLLERLVVANYDDPLTIKTLEMSPEWDPLRNHPKFKALLKRST